VRQPDVHVARLASPVYRKLGHLRSRSLLARKRGVPRDDPVPRHQDFQSSVSGWTHGGCQPNLRRCRRRSFQSIDGGGKGPSAVTGRSCWLRDVPWNGLTTLMYMPAPVSSTFQCTITQTSCNSLIHNISVLSVDTFSIFFLRICCHATHVYVMTEKKTILFSCITP